MASFTDHLCAIHWIRSEYLCHRVMSVVYVTTEIDVPLCAEHYKMMEQNNGN
jgi:hypothetical protein